MISVTPETVAVASSFLNEDTRITNCLGLRRCKHLRILHMNLNSGVWMKYHTCTDMHLDECKIAMPVNNAHTNSFPIVHKSNSCLYKLFLAMNGLRGEHSAPSVITTLSFGIRSLNVGLDWVKWESGLGETATHDMTFTFDPSIKPCIFAKFPNRFVSPFGFWVFKSPILWGRNGSPNTDDLFSEIFTNFTFVSQLRSPILRSKLCNLRKDLLVSPRWNVLTIVQWTYSNGQVDITKWPNLPLSATPQAPADLSANWDFPYLGQDFSFCVRTFLWALALERLKQRSMDVLQWTSRHHRWPNLPLPATPLALVD